VAFPLASAKTIASDHGAVVAYAAAFPAPYHDAAEASSLGAFVVAVAVGVFFASEDAYSEVRIDAESATGDAKNILAVPHPLD
jgi:hypothetical protein